MHVQMPANVQVSPACRDLLARIFVVDPAQRIDMVGVVGHPWFQEGLAALGMTSQGACFFLRLFVCVDIAI